MDKYLSITTLKKRIKKQAKKLYLKNYRKVQYVSDVEKKQFTELLEKAANTFEIDAKLILSTKRTQDVSLVRAVIAFILRVNYRYSLQKTAFLLKRKDHTTIINLTKKVSIILRNNNEFALKYKQLLEEKPKWISKGHFFFAYNVPNEQYKQIINEIENNIEIRKMSRLSLNNRETIYYLVEDLEKFYNYRHLGAKRKWSRDSDEDAFKALERARKYDDYSDFKIAEKINMPKVNLGLKPIVKQYIEVS